MYSLQLGTRLPGIEEPSGNRCGGIVVSNILRFTLAAGEVTDLETLEPLRHLMVRMPDRIHGWSVGRMGPEIRRSSPGVSEEIAARLKPPFPRHRIAHAILSPHHGRHHALMRFRS